VVGSKMFDIKHDYLHTYSSSYFLFKPNFIDKYFKNNIKIKWSINLFQI